MPRPARLLLATALGLTLLAGCGEAPKVSSTEYLGRCKTQLGHQLEDSPTVTVTRGQFAAICQCIQRKLVAAGLGGKRVDDKALERRGQTLGRDCALQVLAGR